MDLIKKYFPYAYTVIASLVFLDSLRFKFTDHPNTQEIFGRLNEWAASLGADGLFGHTGLFSQYVIGSAELLASILLIVSLIFGFKRLQGVAALLAAAIMTGAVSFHLFTPLGIDPNNDGAGLFAMAVTIWATSLLMVLLRTSEIYAFGKSTVCALLKK